MKCKYCGKDNIKNQKGLATHRRYSKKCFDLWSKEQAQKNESYFKNNNFVECKVCGRMLRNISNTHLKSCHGITQQEYKTMFPDAPIFAEDLLITQKENRQATLTKRYYDKNINIHDSCSEFFFIKKYGEEEGKYLYEEHCKSVGLSKENFIKKYGEEEGLIRYDLFCEQRRGICSLDWYVEKYGEELGIEKYNDVCTAKSYGHTIDWYIEKYGEDGKEIFNFINSKKALTMNNFIQKYGEIDGPVKYKKMMENKNFLGFSQIASDMFVQIDAQFEGKLYYATLNNPKEYGIYLERLKHYCYVDCYCLETNKVIKFFGNYWHANPSIYNQNDIISFPNKMKVEAKTIWNRDKKRLDEIKRLRNCEILIIWEEDYNNDKEGTIIKCLNFLKN